MEIHEAAKYFYTTLPKEEWLSTVGTENDRIVVYVYRMGLDVWNKIPQSFDGKQVLVHFDGSRVPNNKYHTVLTKSFVDTVPTEELKAEEPSSDVSLGFDVLLAELDSLEALCGSNILQDIFYEVHDGKNAITNLSDKYPEVRKRMEVLYDAYGFDVIYEELDG